MSDRNRAWTPLLLAAFFTFGTVMTALAAASLAWPSGPAAAIWRWKPDEYQQLLAMGPIVPIGFGLLSAAMAATTYGSFGRHRWGWRLAVIIFTANAFADTARAVADKAWSGLIGVAVVALILWWLSRREVRGLFTGPDAR